MGPVDTHVDASDELLIGALPRSALGRLALRLSVLLHHRRLDRMLAEGREPWSRADLSLRAGQLLALPSRCGVATAIGGLLDIAELGGVVCPYAFVRSEVVLKQRDLLLRIAARLRDPAPVAVAPVVVLRSLTSSRSSPAFVGGRPASGFAPAVQRCASQLGVSPGAP